MGCRTNGGPKKPCGCKTCGPYTLDPMGTYRTPDGETLELDAPRPHPRRSEKSLGARLERAWNGGRANRQSEAHRPTFGTQPDTVLRAGSGAFGSGGDGSSVGARPVWTGDPIGARPSVADVASINMAQIDKPMPPEHDAYGALPAELLSERVFGVAAPGAIAMTHSGISAPVVSSDSESALLQYAPPLPAPQQPCFINGFNPSWGTPPAVYHGIALQFDPGVGAYAFDPARALQGVSEGSERKRAGLDPWLRKIQQRYSTGFMLQPYKAPGREGHADPWLVRWIVQRREVSCT